MPAVKKEKTERLKFIFFDKNNSLWFPAIVSISFFIVSLIGILNHEMWRDEFQSWLIARDSHSISQLYQNCKFEGHPIFWYFILFILTVFTKSTLAFQFLNLFLGTSFIFLFNRFSEFKKIEKLLFTFGYYSVFEFTMISRSYNLEMLLIAIILMLLRNSQNNFLWMFLTLFLLANVSAFGLLFAICFGIIILLDEQLNLRKIEHTKVSLPKYFVSIFIFIAGIIFSIIQIKPEQGNLVKTDSTFLFDTERLKIVFSRIYDAFTLIPESKLLPYWNFAGTMRLDYSLLFWDIIFSIIIIIICLIILWRKPIVVLFFVVLCLGIFLLCDLPYLIAVRYTGRFFLAFIFSIWLANYFPKYEFKLNFNKIISDFGIKIEHEFLILILGIQLIIGAMYFYTDLKMPFSSSKQISDELHKMKLDKYPVIGAQDYAVSPFAALMHKNIFYPESKTFGSFIIWDNNLRKNQNPDFGIVANMIDSLMTSVVPKAIVILNTLPVGDKGKLEHDFISKNIRMDFILQSEKCMVADEYYYVYLATRVENK